MKSLALAAVLLALSGPALAREPVFDIHVHLHKGEASIPDYEAQLKAANLTVAGFGAMWFGGPHQAPEGKVEQTRTNNDLLIAIAARHRGMLPIATVHPYEGAAAIAELERVAARGVKVLKIHPHTQRFDAADPRVLTLAKRAGELGVVVMMDNAAIVPDDCEKLFNLALAAPKTKFLFAHMGGLNFRFWNILALARTAENLFGDNIYFDLSAVANIAAASPIADELVWTIRNVGVDNVLIGSDFPQLTLPATLAALDKLELTPEEKAKIRYGNAKRLFGLE